MKLSKRSNEDPHCRPEDANHKRADGYIELRSHNAVPAGCGAAGKVERDVYPGRSVNYKMQRAVG